MEPASVYDFAGGRGAFLALASALHERALADPVLNHPFSHTSDPAHVEHLADYLGEVFGGPPAYSELGGHSAMLAMHASTGANADFAERFVSCFDLAIDDAGLPQDATFRQVLHDYMVAATFEVDRYSPMGSVAPEGLPFPHWSWDGPVS